MNTVFIWSLICGADLLISAWCFESYRTGHSWVVLAAALAWGMSGFFALRVAYDYIGQAK